MNGNGTKWKWKQLKQTDNLSVSSRRHRSYLQAYFICKQQHARKCGRAFNLAARNLDRKMLRKQNKTNAEKDTEDLKMRAPPNKRSHIHLTKTKMRWQ
jgi:hypothetical protein